MFSGILASSKRSKFKRLFPVYVPLGHVSGHVISTTYSGYRQFWRKWITCCAVQWMRYDMWTDSYYSLFTVILSHFVCWCRWLVSQRNDWWITLIFTFGCCILLRIYLTGSLWNFIAIDGIIRNQLDNIKMNLGGVCCGLAQDRTYNCFRISDVVHSGTDITVCP
jgi:hypothetical protein